MLYLIFISKSAFAFPNNKYFSYLFMFYFTILSLFAFLQKSTRYIVALNLFRKLLKQLHVLLLKIVF